MMEFFTYKPQSKDQRTIVDSPAFLKPGSSEKITVCGNTTPHPNKEDD